MPGFWFTILNTRDTVYSLLKKYFYETGEKTTCIVFRLVLLKAKSSNFVCSPWKTLYFKLRSSLQKKFWESFNLVVSRLLDFVDNKMQFNTKEKEILFYCQLLILPERALKTNKETNKNLLPITTFITI